MDDIISRIDRTKSIVEQVNQVACEVANLLEYTDVIEYPLIVDTYHVLQNRETVCSGYCNVMYNILKRMRIYSEVVDDETKFHCWMYFQDGNNGYYIDPTWYDTTRSDTNFMSRDMVSFMEYQTYVLARENIAPLTVRQIQFKN